MRSTLLRLLGPLTLAAVTAACGSVPTGSASNAPSAPPAASGSVDPLGSGFQGHVSDPEGNPIEGALVQIEQGEFHGTAITTEEGNFQTRGVVGSFVITVSHFDFESAVRRVDVGPGEFVEIEFVLEPAPES